MAATLRRRLSSAKSLATRLRKAALGVARNAIRPLTPASVGYPRGSFSALKLLNEKRVPGRVILLDQGAPEASPESIMVRSRLRQHLEQPWPIFWTRHQNARLVANSLTLVDDERRICLEAAYSSRWFRDDPAYSYFISGEPQRLEGPWTSLVSRWCPSDGRMIYAHWLLESLPRLAVLSEFPAETRILLPKQVETFQQRTLEWLGVADRCVPTDARHLSIAQYYFTAPPAMIVCWNPYAVRYVREQFLPRRSPRNDLPKRFYLTRGKAPYRSVRNEEEVAAFFQSLGWAVVDPARLDIADQIALFADAEAIVGPHGSAFANIVWCSPGATLIELFADRFLSGCYEWVAQTVQARHHFIIFPDDGRTNALVDIGILQSRLHELRLL